jgi:hypothetical protein
MNSGYLYSLIIGVYIYSIGEGKLSPHATMMHVGTSHQGRGLHGEVFPMYGVVEIVEIGPRGNTRNWMRSPQRNILKHHQQKCHPQPKIMKGHTLCSTTQTSLGRNLCSTPLRRTVAWATRPASSDVRFPHGVAEDFAFRIVNIGALVEGEV